jgi:Xaa-Pro aminopeptidase
MIIDPREILHESRRRVRPGRATWMRRAAAISAEAHSRDARARAHEGMADRAEVDTLIAGRERAEISSIIASGPNAAILLTRKPPRDAERASCC